MLCSAVRYSIRIPLGIEEEEEEEEEISGWPRFIDGIYLPPLVAGQQPTL